MALSIDLPSGGQPNPSIERTGESTLRVLPSAAHVELQGLPRFVEAALSRDGNREASHALN